jgi:hypothetical protein
MKENFDSGEKPRHLSEEEVKKMRNLAGKVWEVATWDLTKFCSTNEELDFVRKAQDAMSEVMAMFDMSLDRFGNWNRKDPAPLAPKTLSPDDILKLRASLEAIEEVIEWDLGASDEAEIAMIHKARESLKELKSIL